MFYDSVEKFGFSRSEQADICYNLPKIFIYKNWSSLEIINQKGRNNYLPF